MLVAYKIYLKKIISGILDLIKDGILMVEMIKFAVRLNAGYKRKKSHGCHQVFWLEKLE